MVTLEKVTTVGGGTIQLLPNRATVTIMDDRRPCNDWLWYRASYSVTEGAGAVVNLDTVVIGFDLDTYVARW